MVLDLSLVLGLGDGNFSGPLWPPLLDPGLGLV